MFLKVFDFVIAAATLLAGLVMILIIFTDWEPDKFLMAFAIGWAGGTTLALGIQRTVEFFYKDYN